MRRTRRTARDVRMGMCSSMKRRQLTPRGPQLKAVRSRRPLSEAKGIDPGQLEDAVRADENLGGRDLLQVLGAVAAGEEVDGLAGRSAEAAGEAPRRDVAAGDEDVDGV